MFALVRSSALVLALFVLRTATAADPPALDSHLEPLRHLLGKTWKSTFPENKPNTPMTDVMRWEQVLNGKAVRILHSINDGVYGGETIIRWDSEQNAITYYYFTTADFMTTGTMTADKQVITTSEKVKNNPQGITAVRGTTELMSDGKLHVKTEYEKDGKWSPGRDVIYEEAPGAEVKFK